ncbi:MAG: Ig-like domain-containing protein, partial [Actinomycetota bacterium]
GVFALGDLAYPDGSTADFTNCYDPTWGAERARTKPVAGNHEWIKGSLTAYLNYFGSAATGAGGTSYYSYDVGPYWHVVVLDSECKKVPGGCGQGSPQDRWLESDLAANRSKNVIAMYHRPLRSSDSSSSAVKPFWDDFYPEGVDLVLDGHAHMYERLAPLTPTGSVDGAYGIPTFTVGSGGESGGTITSVQPSSQVLNLSTYGVLKLTLHPSSYDWQFMGVAGASFTDAGTYPTHGRPGAGNTSPTAVPQSVTTPQDVAKTVTLAGTDPDGNALTYRIESLPTHGQLFDGPTASGSPLAAGAAVTDATHRVTFTPTAGYAGSDAFTFTVNDGTATSAPATVSIAVTAPNTAPVAQDVTTVATAGVARTITLTGTDTGSCELSFDRPAATLPSGATVSAPSPATCTGTGPFTDTATVTYTAPANLAGPDSFTYTASDGSLPSNTATISITVSAPPPNTAPVAQDVTATATSGVPTTITLTGTDAENCELSFDRPATTLGSGATVSAPTPATCTGTGPFTDTATVTYTAPANLTGPDSFTYTVNDGIVASTTATVSIEVGAAPPGVTFRSSSVGANSVGTSLVVGTPAGVQAGDVMIAVIDVKAAPTVTTPAGWTLVSATSNGSNFRQLVYSRVATGAEPPSTTWSLNQSRAASGAIAAYAGADTTAPIQTFSAEIGTTTAITAPSVTTIRDGSMIVGGFGINADSTIAPPAGMTERGEIVSATRLRTELSDYVLSPAGATGDKVATAATAAATIGQLIVVRSA